MTTQSTPAQQNGRLTTIEAAAFLGILPHMVYDLRYKGEIKGIKEGRRVFYTREELQAYQRGETMPVEEETLVEEAQEEVVESLAVTHPLMSELEQQVMGKIVELVTERVEATHAHARQQERLHREEVAARLRRMRAELDELLEIMEDQDEEQQEA